NYTIMFNDNKEIKSIIMPSMETLSKKHPKSEDVIHNNIDRKNLKTYNDKEHCMTIGMLIEFIKLNPDLPSNTPVLYQRIEDVYFEKHNWTTEPFKYENGTHEYIKTFCIFRYTDKKTKKESVLITAHY
ncbi:MAG: hypothetical protein ACYCTB_11480, partial [bacterium]